MLQTRPILFATFLKLPVSTTHVIAGSIAGVGSIQRLKAVRWGLAENIIWAWILTIPAAISASAFIVVQWFHTLLCSNTARIEALKIATDISN